MNGPQPRVSSPCFGSSIFSTSAPMSPSIIVQNGPATTRVRSTILSPCSGGMRQRFNHIRADAATSAADGWWSKGLTGTHAKLACALLDARGFVTVPPAADPGNDERAALVHPEVFRLCALIALAVAAFFVTRAVADSNRDMVVRDGAEWFRRGEQAMQAGRLDEAIASLRHATVRNRANKQYVLQLARALALDHDEDGARSVLLALREADPEDRDVNLQLARLAAARQDVSDALRFYHNALYAPWPLDQDAARRTVRLELVRLLLANRQSGRATAELIALTSEMPDEAPLHEEMGELFAGAGDDA